VSQGVLMVVTAPTLENQQALVVSQQLPVHNSNEVKR